MKYPIRILGLVLSLSLLIPSLSSAQFAGRRQLRGHRTAAMAAAPLVGEIESGRKFQLAVILPPRDQDGLSQLLKDLYDPHSPSYHRFLTPDQYTARFGPTAQDARAVADYMSARGLRVTKIHSNRVIVDVEGDNDAIQKAFHVRLHKYQRPDGSAFFGPDGDPSVDLDTPIAHISGLDDFVPFRPAPRQKSPRGGSPADSANQGGSLAPIDLRAAYAPDVAGLGSGQTVALFELSTYDTTDIPVFQAYAPTVSGQSATLYSTFGPVSDIFLDGWNSSTPPGSQNNAGEVSLDIECVEAMAPQAAVNVYMGSNPDDVLNQIATDDTCKQISASWEYGCVGTAFSQFAAQGQSYLNASGDWESYGSPLNENNPNSSSSYSLNFDFVTIVGGTNMSTTGNPPAYVGETAWPLSGGGVLTLTPIPTYQQGINMSANGGSITNRNAPDVGACAQNVWIYATGSWGTWSGTSVSTPLWAGFLALANQQAVAKGASPVGWANPALYQIGQGSHYGFDFHDITSGNNSGFNAVPGYDLVTGWGSPAGQYLIDDLTGVAFPTPTVTPTPTPQSTWRVVSGGGNAYTDCQGNAWSADENFSIALIFDNAVAISKALPCATDQYLYQNILEYPSFTYTFPVPPGTYQVTLKFAEIADGAGGMRNQSVTINGTQVLSNFDPWNDAGGPDIADDKVFNNISPVNGRIVITFTGNPNSPDQDAEVNAIQIVPQSGTPVPTATPTATPTGTLATTATVNATATPTANLACGTSPVGLELLEFTSLNGNQASENFEVVNTGSTALNLSQVTVKFWIDDTTGQSVVGAVNYGGCTGTNCAAVAGVALSAANFSPACGPDPTNQANWELTLSNTSTGTLSAGTTWANVQTQIHLANFAGFSSTADWYSPSSIGGGNTYTNDLHYAVYYQGNLVTASGGVPPSCRQPSCTPGTLTPGLTPSSTNSPTATPTASATASRTPTAPFTATGTPSLTATASATVSRTFTASFTATGVAGTATSTPTRTATASPTRTATLTPTGAAGTATSTPTSLMTATPSLTASRTSTATVTFTPTATRTASPTFSPTPALTPTFTPTPTAGTGCGTSTLALQLEEFGTCGSNQNQQTFEVINKGTSAVTLSDISIKFWADDTTGSAMVGAVNYGGCFGQNCTAVTGAAINTVNFSPACGPSNTQQANWEITVFNTDTALLGAGVTWSNLQTAVHLASYANFSPGTGFWYSPCSVGSGSTYTNNLNYALYVRGNLVTASGGVPPSCRPLPTCTPAGGAARPAAEEEKALTPSPTPTPGAGRQASQVVAVPNVSQGGQSIGFRVTLGEPAPVKLTLYSVAGETVYQAQSQGSAGLNVIPWNLLNGAGSSVASGLYIYVVEIDGPGGAIYQTGKVVVLR